MRPASRALRPPLPDFNRITPGSPFPAILGCRAMTMEHDDKEAVPDAAPEGAIPPPEAGAPPVQEPSGVPAGAEPATGDSAPGDAAAAAVPEAGGGTPEPAPVAEGDAPEAPAAPPAEAAKPATRTPLDIRRVIEALLFSCDAPLTPAKIREAIPRISAQAIRDAVDLLRAEYAQAGHAFELVEIAEGFQILTRPEYDDSIARLKKARAQAKLSAAALETLAIIAYKQPIRRVDIEAIRGVQSGELVRALMERGLIKIAGRADQPGSPLLYGTTKDFLDAVGLKSLAELPKPEEVK
jgi:segregation and condensation protein B